MSFKVEIEIKGYDGDKCRDCNLKVFNGWQCKFFDIALKWDQNRKGIIFYRCPECIEAEKKYKEKENAKVPAP